MDVTDIIEPLNDAQREAITTATRSTLVLAGAGSGKTRVLTHRIAWLLRVENHSPYAVLAVTFTNKAAAQMRSRIEEIIGQSAAGMWVGTFHGLAHRMLRSHFAEAGLPQAFQIIDSDDQQRLIKRITRDLGIDDKHWPPKRTQWYINGKKDEGLRPAHLQDHGDPTERRLIQLYEAYQKACDQGGLLDFAEILLRSHELLLQRADILEHYRQRFRHLLVDEFQDTNAIQYAWIRLLAGEQNSLFVVGDDDQSIYGWRGAKVENIQRFSEDFPSTGTVRLEQNYRSSANILEAANAVIANNSERLGKQLWTEDADGEPIKLYNAYNETDEARYVIETIQEHVQQGGARADCAILYRSNAQSRVFEETLIALGVPYRVYGGLRFFERAEIKDALAYLRLIKHRGDDASFDRAINTPTRGIGLKTLQAIREHARAIGSSQYQAAVELAQAKQPNARAANAIQSFTVLLDQVEAQTRGLDLANQVADIIQASGLLAHYEKDKTDKGRARVENLEELVSAARAFDNNGLDALDDPEAPDLDPLTHFLAHAALEAGEAQGDAWEDCVQLMTLHSAKGLEFPKVYLVGLEDGLFPSQRSLESEPRLQEERRLAYVGITRAREQLTISWAERRRLYGDDTYCRPSRFIDEIPKSLLQEVRARGAYQAPPHQPNRAHSPANGSGPGGHHIGQSVRHNVFGEGTVIAFEGDGPHARIQINFLAVGAKWLVLAYAKLEAA